MDIGDDHVSAVPWNIVKAIYSKARRQVFPRSDVAESGCPGGEILRLRGHTGRGHIRLRSQVLTLEIPRRRWAIAQCQDLTPGTGARFVAFIDGVLDLLKRIGIPSENRNPAIHLGADEQAWAGQWLQENGFQGEKIIAIHPGAHYETQRWLPEYYAELIDLVRRQTQSDVILMGGATDAKTVDDIRSMVKTDVCVCIQYDLRKFFALLSQCQVLVCNNSGPLHCAVALNIPTISFMGPTVKEQWMPVGEIHQVLRMADLPCIGCNLGYCKIKTHDCMRLIRPETVITLMQSCVLILQ